MTENLGKTIKVKRPFPVDVRPSKTSLLKPLLSSGTGNGDKGNSDSGNEIGTVAHPLYPNSGSHVTLAIV